MLIKGKKVTPRLINLYRTISHAGDYSIGEKDAHAAAKNLKGKNPSDVSSKAQPLSAGEKHDNSGNIEEVNLSRASKYYHNGHDYAANGSKAFHRPQYQATKSQNELGQGRRAKSGFMNDSEMRNQNGSRAAANGRNSQAREQATPG